MALTVAELNAKLTLDADSFNRGLKKSEDQAEDFAGKTSSGFKKLGGVIAGAFAAEQVLEFGASTVMVASDVAESANKVSAVFGTQGKAINDWAKTTADAMGISRAEALEAAGGFGNLLDQLGFGDKQAADMSKSMIKLAADFGSFNNLPTEQVLNAMTSAFRGEYDALQAVVPTINAAKVEQEALNMTGKESAKTLTDQEKAAAVYKLMVDGAGQAAGDFEKTQGSLANRMKEMQARFDDVKVAIGERLLPIVLQAAEWLGKNLPIAWEAVKKAINDARPIIDAIGDRMKAMWQVFKGIADLLIGVFTGDWSRAWEGIKGIFTGVWNTITSTIRVIWETIKGIVGGGVESIVGFIAGLPGRIASAAVGMFDGIRDAFKGALNWIIDKWNNFQIKLGGQTINLPFGQSFTIPSITLDTPNLPRFHEGGVVPGPRGAEVPIMAQAGETVVPAGQSMGGSTINIVVNGALDPVATARQLREMLLDLQRTTGPLGFDRA